MTETVLPPNVYRVAQRRFDAIPGSPWVYWIPQVLVDAFERYRSSMNVEGTDGHKTADNARFIRYFWELPSSIMETATQWRQSARAFEQVRYGYCYGQVVDWSAAAYCFYLSNASSSCLNKGLWDKGGVGWSRVASRGFNARRFPPGYVPDVATPAVYLRSSTQEAVLTAVLNARLGQYILALLNPTINYALGDIRSFPLVSVGDQEGQRLETLVCHAEMIYCFLYANDETMPISIVPPRWDTGLDDLTAAHARLTNLERQIDNEVYRLYGISDEDRAAIEAELAGRSSAGAETKEKTEPPMTAEELAVRWISYAVGIVLGRFTIGDLRFTNDQPPIQNRQSKIGNAIYRREDFAVGSLPAPDEAEFDQLVGPVERFAYVDANGGRHLFPAEVEAALRDLALPDGIAVLDEGHERDLSALVEKVLALMWGAEAAQEIIVGGAGGDLRKFLSRDFFTRWHLRWYRKRPVYWPLQSAKRNYGFVLFHERVNKATLYVLQRDYLDHKLNGLRLQIGDLRGQAEPLSGAARKRVERQMDRTTQQLDEITEFAATMERVVREGYEPAPDWIDDGVILRLAPLWELIPVWKSEPKKYWERLGRGDYDWSHIAMRYWPERVREKCKENKSFAIAHGHEEWYEGE
jgi:hypothetical protein